MSARELTRVEVLSRIKAGTLSLQSAATLLGVIATQSGWRSGIGRKEPRA